MQGPTRTETDSLGPIEVPADRYWGAQTERARRHFAIGDERVPRELLRAYGLVKKAGALTHAELGTLDPEVASLIVRAADELVAGELDAHFPLVVWQTGSGTQTNMNVNEVLANRAIELAGGVLGSKRPVHPNDHVNRAQSSNDTFPTAMHLAILEAVEDRLLPAVAALAATLRERAAVHGHHVKIGRTHLQDATPLLLGQEIGGWASQLEAAGAAIRATLPPLRELAIGATAVGTGLNTPPGWTLRVVEVLRALTGRALVPAPDPFAALAGHDALVATHGALKQLAAAATKVANDVRWLASGPRCGLGELRLPANEPGSSIMPGKVNPTQSEALTMVCVQVFANDAGVGFAASQGAFELNVYKPVLVHLVLQSTRLLADALASFDVHCAQGLEPVPARLEENVARSLMLVTALNPHVGYDAAARIARHAHDTGGTLREAAVALGILSAEAFDRLVVPAAMVRPEGA